MKKYNRFIELDRELDKIYEKGDYDGYLDLLKSGFKQLPEKEQKDSFFLALWSESVIYSTIDRYDECFELLKDTINKGYAFPVEYDRFKPIHDRLDKEGLRKKNEELIQRLKQNSAVKYEVFLPENYDQNKSYPLFLGLHGDGVCNMKEFSDSWKSKPFTDKDIIFAYIQSSQPTCHNCYNWMNDTSILRSDIKMIYDTISLDYSVDKEKLYIGGFSGGAEASLDFTMANILPIKGLIALCPELITDVFNDENVSKTVSNGIKVVLMEGEHSLPVKVLDNIMHVFDRVGLSYEYYINKDSGHNYPHDLSDKLTKSLDFILE